MRHSSLRVRWTAAAAATAGAPLAAQANAGIGFFLPASITLVLAFIPVVAIEGLVLQWRLAARPGRAQWLSFCANGISTLVGGLIGLAADIAIGTATGMAGGAGKVGFLVALALMFGISWWLEAKVVGRMSPESPPGAAARATLLANAITYPMLAVGVAVLVPMDATPIRARMTEVVNMAGVARTEAAEEYQASGRFKAKTLAAPTKHTRRVTVDESGRVVAEIAFPGDRELDGKTLVYEPVMRDRQVVEWRCYVPEAPLKYFPAACRFRSAAGR